MGIISSCRASACLRDRHATRPHDPIKNGRAEVGLHGLVIGSGGVCRRRPLVERLV